MPTNALSVDVEEWFHILNLPTTPPPERWGELPATVEANTQRLLDLFASSGTRATFFVLGWVATHYPELVRRIHAAGHEIACHGDMHELCFEQGEAAFEADLRRALAPLLFAAAAKQQVSGELFEGRWTDIGTVERLAEINSEFKPGTE